MTSNGYRVMDSDMHVQEPVDLWLKYIDPKYRDRAPVGTTNYPADQDLIHEGKVISRLNFQAPHQEEMTWWFHEHHGRKEEFLQYEERGWGPDTQLEAMDKEGIDVAILFPTRGLFAHAKEYDDDDLAAAISRAYNDWLAEFCQEGNERMYGSAMLAAQNVAASAAEVKRARQELKFTAVFLRPNPVRGRNWHNPVYDPLWAECQEQDMAVGFHEGVPCALPVAMGDRFDGHNEDMWLTEHVAAHSIEQMYACLSMIAGGVMERFPRLRVGFLEGNCSWLPFWLWRMDEHYEARAHVIGDKIPLGPSEYFKRQCYASIEADESIAGYVFDWMGDDNIVFSTDYPHPDSKYPISVETLISQPFPKETVTKILWDNCARLYGLS